MSTPRDQGANTFERALALHRQGHLAAAEALCEEVLRWQPAHGGAWHLSGMIAAQSQRFELAAERLGRAAAAAPCDATVHYRRGNALRALGRHERALESFETAIALDPDDAAAHRNRGEALCQLRRFESAAASFDRAIALEPGCTFLAGTRLHVKMQICDWDRHEAALADLEQRILAGEPASPPFPLLALAESSSLQRRAAEIWVREQCPPNGELGPLTERAAAGKIRVGYFSADFRRHAVSMLAAELFERHDRSAFELTAFSFGPDRQDPMRRRVERAFDRFLDVRAQPDLEVARLARTLGIDIAVDLGGFTQHSRPRIFAARAAPVQVSYLGYLGCRYPNTSPGWEAPTCSWTRSPTTPERRRAMRSGSGCRYSRASARRLPAGWPRACCAPSDYRNSSPAPRRSTRSSRWDSPPTGRGGRRSSTSSRPIAEARACSIPSA